jgi:hypothetical protein
MWRVIATLALTLLYASAVLAEQPNWSDVKKAYEAAARTQGLTFSFIKKEQVTDKYGTHEDWAYNTSWPDGTQGVGVFSVMADGKVFNAVFTSRPYADAQARFDRWIKQNEAVYKKFKDYSETMPYEDWVPKTLQGTPWRSIAFTGPKSMIVVGRISWELYPGQPKGRAQLISTSIIWQK